jgi:hypothetical protein
VAQCQWFGLLFGAQLAIGGWHVAHASVGGAIHNMRATCAATLLAASPQHLKFVQFDMCWLVWLMQVAWRVVWGTLGHWGLACGPCRCQSLDGTQSLAQTEVQTEAQAEAQPQKQTHAQTQAQTQAQT